MLKSGKIGDKNLKLGVFFAFFGLLKLGGVFKILVNYLVFSIGQAFFRFDHRACQLRFHVFYYYYTVTLALRQG